MAQASDGPTAVETAESFQPDVAILDIGMPGMNGYMVAHALREKPDGASLVLVALSGLGQQEDKARAAEAGFDRHFTKPVDVNALRAYLATAGRDRSVRTLFAVIPVSLGVLRVMSRMSGTSRPGG